MRYAAVIREDRVENVICINEHNAALFQAQGIALVDAAPLGLTLGDRREDGVWYRDAQGVPAPLLCAAQE